MTSAQVASLNINSLHILLPLISTTHYEELSMPSCTGGFRGSSKLSNTLF